MHCQGRATQRSGLPQPRHKADQLPPWKWTLGGKNETLSLCPVNSARCSQWIQIRTHLDAKVMPIDNGTPSPGLPVVGTRKRLQIIYVLGSGRSGTTLLDIILGSNPKVLSSGELAYLSARASDPSQPCSCGIPLDSCPIWSGTVNEIFVGPEYSDRRKRASQFEAYRSLPIILISRLLPTTITEEHLTLMKSTIRAATRGSEFTTFVDSSKNPVRGLLYDMLPRNEFEVKYIHLVRDGRETLRAILRWREGGAFDSKNPPNPGQFTATPFHATPPYSYSITRSVVMWVVDNLASSIVGYSKQGRYLRIKYEDLTSRPTDTILTIQSFVGINLSEALEHVAFEKPFRPGHLVAGNRLRYRREIIFHSESASSPPSSGGTPLSFSLIGSWLNWLYGYSR